MNSKKFKAFFHTFWEDCCNWNNFIRILFKANFIAVEYFKLKFQVFISKELFQTICRYICKSEEQTSLDIVSNEIVRKCFYIYMYFRCTRIEERKARTVPILPSPHPSPPLYLFDEGKSRPCTANLGHIRTK